MILNREIASSSNYPYPTEQEWEEFRVLSYGKDGGAYERGLELVARARDAAKARFRDIYMSGDGVRTGDQAAICRMIDADAGGILHMLEDTKTDRQGKVAPRPFVMPFHCLSMLCTNVLGISCHEFLFGYRGRIPLPRQLAVVADLFVKNDVSRKSKKISYRLGDSVVTDYKSMIALDALESIYVQAVKNDSLRPQPRNRIVDRVGASGRKLSDETIDGLLVMDRLCELAEDRDVDITLLLDEEPGTSRRLQGGERANPGVWGTAPSLLKMTLLSIAESQDRALNQPDDAADTIGAPKSLRSVMFISQRLGVDIDYFLLTDYTGQAELGWEYFSNVTGQPAWRSLAEGRSVNEFISRYLRLNRNDQRRAIAAAIDIFLSE